jgi:hypothetical protein
MATPYRNRSLEFLQSLRCGLAELDDRKEPCICHRVSQS